MSEPTIERSLPVSPNIQNYRPQLTSVLSVAHRIAGVVTVFTALALVAWLTAAAAGPQAYAAANKAIASPTGQIALFIATFALFLHLCAGIRHLAWDAGWGFDLRAIYASGWAVVLGSVVLTAVAWAASLLLKG